MQAVGVWVLTRGGRVVAMTAGLMVLLALQPEPARPVQTAAAGVAPNAKAARTLIISEQARRYLVLQYRSFPTEFMGCMIGDRKSTRLNSSHDQISYAVFCLKKKKKNHSSSNTPSC